MNVLQFATLAITGFVACAEFGSYAFVHPVLRRLPPEYHLQVEKGLLGTFGRIMPVGMTLAPVLAIIYASNSAEDALVWPRWAAVAALSVALVTTISVNVGINRATGHWDPDNPPADWRTTRQRWERFQAIRSWLLLAGFVLLCVAASVD